MDITQLNTEELIARYVKIRDGKSDLEAEHKQKKARFDAALNKIEGILMQRMENDGEESKKTKAGTCYKAIKTTAKVADRDAFLEYVKENDAWDFIESRVNAKEVEKFVEKAGELPPGVTTTRFVKVGVRRATTGE